MLSLDRSVGSLRLNKQSLFLSVVFNWFDSHSQGWKNGVALWSLVSIQSYCDELGRLIIRILQAHRCKRRILRYWLLNLVFNRCFSRFLIILGLILKIWLRLSLDLIFHFLIRLSTIFLLAGIFYSFRLIYNIKFLHLLRTRQLSLIFLTCIFRILRLWIIH